MLLPRRVKYRKTQRGKIELIDELAQKTGRMILRHPVFQRRGKEKLLAVIRTNRLCHALSDAANNNKFKF